MFAIRFLCFPFFDDFHVRFFVVSGDVPMSSQVGVAANPAYVFGCL